KFLCPYGINVYGTKNEIRFDDGTEFAYNDSVGGNSTHTSPAPVHPPCISQRPMGVVMSDHENMFLDLIDLERQTRLSRASIYRAISRGELPKPTKIGRRSLWPRTELQNWFKRSEQQ